MKKIEDEKVKVRHINKYPCKRNKGNHEWDIPLVKDDGAYIRYVYKLPEKRTLDSGEPTYRGINHDEAYFSIHVEVRCMWCGKTIKRILREKI